MAASARDAGSVRWLGSIAVHVVLGGLLLLVGHRARALEPAVTIEVIAPPAPAIVAPSAASGPAAAAPSVRTRARRAAPPARGEPTTRASSLLGDVAVEAVGEGGGGGGEGGGAGGGGGGGAGGRLVVDPRVVQPVVLPPAPKLSKARPAILIFPSRQTEVEDAALYIAEVIVDDEGFVVGAKLARGFGGARDVQAGSLIWRFRYSPALDDDGRPIRSTVQQKFAVAW